MKKLVMMALALIFLAGVANAGWRFDKVFPDTTRAKVNTGTHGIALDPAGNVWVQPWGKNDSISDGTKFWAIRAVYVYSPNGTAASFSPIRIMVGAGIQDTLWNSGLGLQADQNGNILLATYNTLYRINYKTGTAMNKYVNPDPKGWVKPGVDDAGEIFIGTVLPGFPYRILDPDFNYIGNAVDTGMGYSRACDVSRDGNDFYLASYGHPAPQPMALYRYHSDNGSIGPYVCRPQDTLMRGTSPESIGWNKKTGILYVAAGHHVYSSPTAEWSFYTWYGMNPANGAIVDSIKWNRDPMFLGSGDTRPRGIAFTASGDTVYVACFGSATYGSVQRFIRTGTGVSEQGGTVPEGYALEQNYPNPFNPTTEINFTIAKSQQTTLRVYDVLGRVVATLVDGVTAAGSHAVTFDAAKLSAGVYVYELATADGHRISKKMSLVK